MERMKAMKKHGKAMKIIIVTLVVIIALLAGTVALASAYPDHAILQYFVIENPFTESQMDMSTFLRTLKANGFIYDDIIEETQYRENFLSVGPKRILFGDENITVYEFNSNREMELEAGYIDPGGFGITRPGTGVQISWVSTPYWFKSDLIIVLYVGENEQIINFLLKTFGDPFAGGAYT